MVNSENYPKPQEPEVPAAPVNSLRQEQDSKRFRDIENTELLKPIPLEMKSVEGWKEVELRENSEPMVPLGPFSENHDLFTSSVYYGEHSNSPYMSEGNKLEGSLITLFVREEVAAQLRHAQQLLPEGHYLIVLDSYRTLQVQQALYDHYLNALKQHHPDWDEETLNAETQKYVSLPSQVPSRPSPHNTGGAVDVAIYRLPVAVDRRVQEIGARLETLKQQAPKEFTPADEARDPVLREFYKLEMEKISLVHRHAQFLEFGTQFDHGGAEAASNHFERLEQQRPLSAEEAEARDNRRMLHNAMVQAGLEAYEDEWWHFNSPKSQMGAKTAGLDHAEYGGMELDEPNLAHEHMRQAHRSSLVRIQEGLMQGLRFRLAGKMSNEAFDELVELNEDVLNETGDPRLTHLPKAAIIEPPRAAA